MTTLTWHSGTSYDFFISLKLLHDANAFGLRPSWTAGVRQRLAAHHREFLEQVIPFTALPLDWISSLDGSLDAGPVLARLEAMPARDCMLLLAMPENATKEIKDLVQEIITRGTCSAREKELLTRGSLHHERHLKPAELKQLIECWTHPQETRQRMLDALLEYQAVFFQDEEKRIQPILLQGLQNARQLAGRLPLPELVEELSRGVHFAELENAHELILVPSFWLTPFVIPTTPSEGRMQMVFGCRSPRQGIAPGAESIDKLVNSLKALADPTRLCILQYLGEQPLTPTELSRRLRLRPPTVLHHLRMLRLAELVTIHISEGGEKRYSARVETTEQVFKALTDHLAGRD
jgi:DNA-binding transcriptional ArsR family regulator